MTARISHTPSPSEAPHVFQGELFETRDPADTLKGQYEYAQLDSPELRMKYVAYTESLIQQAVEDKIDDIVFLDKSARPIAWLMKGLWPMLGIDDEGKPAKMPDIRYVNIDREQWGPVVGRSEDKDGGIDLSRVHPHAIEDLRSVFAVQNSDGLSPDQSFLDNKNVMVVDEVMTSGDTLRIAHGLFSRAFPSANITDRYWLPIAHKTTRGGARMNAELPVWYSDYDQHGRLVADRHIKASENSINARQRRGAMFLSTRFPHPDQKGITLRKEMTQLAHEVEDGVMPVIPSGGRSIEAIEIILKDVNGLSVDEYVALRKDAEAKKESLYDVALEYKIERSKRHHPAAS